MWPYGWTRMFLLLVFILINQLLHCESRPSISPHHNNNKNEDGHGHLSKATATDVIPKCQLPISSYKKIRVPTRIARNSKLLRSSSLAGSGGSHQNGVIGIDELNLDLSPPQHDPKSPVYRTRFRPGRLTQIHQPIHPTLDFHPFEVDLNNQQQLQPPHQNQKNQHHQTSSVQQDSSNNNDDLSSSPIDLTPRSEDVEEDDGNNNNNNNNVVEEDPNMIDDNMVAEENSNAAAAAEAASITPYISPRALSNMGKFFEHLQENILAAMLQQDRFSDEIGQPARRRMTSSSSDNSALSPAPLVMDDKGPNNDLPSPSSSSSWGDSNNVNSKQQDMVDYSSESSETVTVPSIALTWPPPGSRFFRTSSSNSINNNYNNNNKGHRNSPWSSSLLSPANGRLSEKMQGFLDPLTIQEEELKRTSYYNPSWLWTNMGLGKRRRRR